MDLNSRKPTHTIFTLFLILSLTCSVHIIVRKCPITKTAWQVRSQNVICESPLVYHCIQDDVGSLIETCMAAYEVKPFREVGCPWAFYSKDRGSILGGVFHKCEGNGCPQKNDSDYWTNEMYKYPICLHHYNETITDVTDTTEESSVCSAHATDIPRASNDTNKTCEIIAIVTTILLISAVLAWKYRRILKSCVPADHESYTERIPLIETDKGTRLTQMNETDKDSRNEWKISPRDKNISKGVKSDLCKDLHKGGWTILHLICLQGKTNLAKQLTNNYENLLCIKDHNGCTPFHLAGYSGSVELVKHLVDKVDVFSKDYNGRTIIHNACQKGHIDLVKYLINKDKRLLNNQDYNGLTPFHCAGFSGSVKLVQYLIGTGCDVYSQDKDGRTIVHIACQKGHIKLAKSVVKIKNDVLQTKDNNGLTPFHCAGFSGSVELVQYLIGNGCEVYSKDNDGRTIVHIACQKGHIKLVEYLIGIDKDILGVKDKDGIMPFQCKDKGGWTIVHKACYEGHTKLVKLLIGSEKSILNEKDKLGMTPFHLAGFSGSVELVQYLIDNGCDIYGKDNYGQTIVHKACEMHRITLVKYLLSRENGILKMEGVNRSTPFHYAGYSGSVDLVQYMIDNGCDVYSKDDDGWTIVHYACQEGHVTLVKHLVDKDKTVLNIKDKNGLTPFHHAGFSGSIELVQCLIDNGADLRSKDYVGNTILHNTCSEGHLDVMKYLIESDNGIIHIKNLYDRTPFSLARQYFASP